MIDAARRRFPVRIIEITAPAAILAQRLAARGRENAADIAARLARMVPVPAAPDVATVINDASLENGVARFVTALIRAA